MIRHFRNARQRTRAQAVVEYAICFPVILMLTFAIIQLAHIFVAKHLISYAAFVAARAAVVDEDYTRAAQLVCSPISGPGGVGTGRTIELPGWGPLKGSGASEVKTRVASVEDVDLDYPAVTMEVEHDFELRIPVANTLAYSLGDMLLASEDFDSGRYGTPHLTIRSRATYSQPWSEYGAAP